MGQNWQVLQSCVQANMDPVGAFLVIFLVIQSDGEMHSVSVALRNTTKVNRYKVYLKIFKNCLCKLLFLVSSSPMYRLACILIYFQFMCGQSVASSPHLAECF